MSTKLIAFEYARDVSEICNLLIFPHSTRYKFHPLVMTQHLQFAFEGGKQLNAYTMLPPTAAPWAKRANTPGLLFDLQHLYSTNE